MIREDYVGFEIAKLLKEKGFDEPCTLSFFDEKSYCEWIETAQRPLYIDNESAKLFRYQNPTLQMAMRWLREVHNLFIEIQYATALFFQPHTTIYFRIYYMSLDYSTSGKDMLPDDYIREYYNSYEEACEAAIKYCLENLI